MTFVSITEIQEVQPESALLKPGVGGKTCPHVNKSSTSHGQRKIKFCDLLLITTTSFLCKDPRTEFKYFRACSLKLYAGSPKKMLAAFKLHVESVLAAQAEMQEPRQLQKKNLYEFGDLRSSQCLNKDLLPHNITRASGPHSGRLWGWGRTNNTKDASLHSPLLRTLTIKSRH